MVVVAEVVQVHAAAAHGQRAADGDANVVSGGYVRGNVESGGKCVSHAGPSSCPSAACAQGVGNLGL